MDHVSADARRHLMQYDWPGNVRELENAIERAVVLSRRRTLDASDFAFLMPPETSAPGRRTLLELEKDHILKTLAEFNWNVTRSAEALGINRVTLHKKIKRYGLKDRD